MVGPVTETAFERVITALERADCKVKWNGGQKAQAQCPHHEDRNPSLTVTAIAGRVLLRCHAGCVIGDIVGKLGLTLADLFDNPRPVKISGISAHAIYRYDNGRSVIRSAAKEFRQAGTDAPPELYRLGKVKAAVAAGEGSTWWRASRTSSRWNRSASPRPPHRWAPGSGTRSTRRR